MSILTLYNIASFIMFKTVERFKFILSKEFKGTSNYEHGIEIVKQDLQKTIDSAQDPESLSRAKEEMRKLDYLYQNFNIGMNVFRTAKGGRDKLRV